MSPQLLSLQEDKIFRSYKVILSGYDEGGMMLVLIIKSARP